jgi:hypothetical protein
VLFFCLLSVSALYAGGKKDVESAVVEDGGAFSETLDISGKKPGKYNFFIKAKDQGGNTAAAGPHNIYIDPLSDLPTPRIINPHEGMRVTGSLNVVGACTDDDGVEWVDLIFNNDDESRVRARGGKFFSYSYDTSALPDGLYTVTALAADSRGLEEIRGRRNLSAVSWNLDLRAPEITLTSHESGALVHGRITLAGTVWDGNGVESLEMSAGEGGPFVPVRFKTDKKTGMNSFSVSLDTAKLPSGPAVIRFRARDKQGSEGFQTSLISVDNEGPEIQLLYPRNEAGPVNGIFYAAGIARDTVGLASLSWQLGRETGDFELVTGNPYWAKEFDIRGQKTRSVELVIRAVDLSGNTAVFKQKIAVDQNGDMPRLSLTSPVPRGLISGSRIPLSGTVEDDDGLEEIRYSLDGGAAGSIPARGGYFQALIPAAAGPHNLKVWARDITGIESAPVEIKGMVVNSPEPAGSPPSRFQLSLGENFPETPWAQNEVSLSLGTGAGEIPGALEYSADLGQTWLPLGSPGSLGGTISLASFPDGYIGLLIRALGADGVPSAPDDYLFFGVNKDTLPPEVVAAAPAGAQVNGPMLLALAVKEAGRLQKAEFTPDPAGEERISLEAAPFLSLLMGMGDLALTDTMAFYVTDAAGNQGVLDRWPFAINHETDLPVVEINLPGEDHLLTGDFVISGISYDDDRVSRIWYRIDDGEEIALEASNSYTIPIALNSLEDNEHQVTVSAEDIYGVRGLPVSRNFRVSRQEPRGRLDNPGQDMINSGILELRGIAADGNGIKGVTLSLDNGHTFNEAVLGEGAGAAGTEPREGPAGTEPEEVPWTYRFDTSVLKDGEYVGYIRVEDNYGETALFTGLINVDNTPPEMNLSSPAEAYNTPGPVVISGQVYDNMGMDRLLLTIRSVEGAAVPEDMRRISIEPQPPLLFYNLDLSSLAEGSYNIDIQALDKAENSTRFSRNITLVREGNLNSIECLYPLSGEAVGGNFNLYGIVRGNDKASTVTLRVNGVDTETVPDSGSGYFRFTLGGQDLLEGINRLAVHSDFDGRGEAVSPELLLAYTPAGPWLTVESMSMGDFAYDRPWLSGRAGYQLSENDQALLADKKADREERKRAAAKKLTGVDLSFDNGKTFEPAALQGREGWRYRVENEGMAAGTYHLLIRASMENGETALTRTMIRIDTAPPSIRLLNPESNGRYNQELTFAALNSDDVQLGEVSYTLRPGDKSLYEVPGFLQGLYAEGHLLGVTLWDAGLGLSFFDDNVKIQFQYGLLTQGNYEFMGGTGPFRYGGNVFAAKLLANLYTLPFRTFLGPDWDWLSATAALGANFSLFTETQSGSPTWMTAFLGQLEFPRVTINQWKYLRSFSFYTEFQLWFVPTDANARERGIPVLVPHATLGLRYYIF